jgi:hypothetical protein
VIGASFYDEAAVAAADKVADAALADFLSRARGDAYGATVLSAVAGAGKSYFVSRAAWAARAQGMRIAVCAPTNEQVFSLVRSIALMNQREVVTMYPASYVTPPPWVTSLENVRIAVDAGTASAATLLVGTFDKLGDAFARGSLMGVDGLLADESYQADSGKYYGVAGLAPVHLLVGDSGQIDPFSTVRAVEQWRGLDENPLQTAVGVVRRNHPELTSLFRFPITRRLDARAAGMARAFYPADHHFVPALLPDVRELRLAGAADGAEATPLDEALTLAATTGWAHLELPDVAVLSADPETLETIVGLVRRLFARQPSLRCERRQEWHALEQGQVAVVVAHNDQKDLLQLRLAESGLGEVMVNTANKLQGLEFEVVVCWHPLAGLTEADEFHADPGRLCVMLTRHRHACIVVGRAGDRVLVEDVPPATPAYLGDDYDPLAEGWRVHQAVFSRLAEYRVMG